MLLEDCSACYSCNPKAQCCNSQVYCDALAPQVIDSEDTADYVSAQVVENKDLPHGFSVFREKRVNLVLCCSCIFAGAFGGSEIVIETQYSLNRRCILSGAEASTLQSASLTYLTIPESLHARRHCGRQGGDSTQLMAIEGVEGVKRGISNISRAANL